jgi:hypothetical protein
VALDWRWLGVNSVALLGNGWPQEQVPAFAFLTNLASGQSAGRRAALFQRLIHLNDARTFFSGYFGDAKNLEPVWTAAIMIISEKRETTDAIDDSFDSSYKSRRRP